jgi:hypothetical protein
MMSVKEPNLVLAENTGAIEVKGGSIKIQVFFIRLVAAHIGSKAVDITLTNGYCMSDPFAGLTLLYKILSSSLSCFLFERSFMAKHSLLTGCCCLNLNQISIRLWMASKHP